MIKWILYLQHFLLSYFCYFYIVCMFNAKLNNIFFLIKLYLYI